MSNKIVSINTGEDGLEHRAAAAFKEAINQTGGSYNYKWKYASYMVISFLTLLAVFLITMAQSSANNKSSIANLDVSNSMMIREIGATLNDAHVKHMNISMNIHVYKAPSVQGGGFALTTERLKFWNESENDFWYWRHNEEQGHPILNDLQPFPSLQAAIQNAEGAEFHHDCAIANTLGIGLTPHIH
jgi:hypothetical protein